MRAPVPDLLPVLGPGAHRRPRDGACFMEWVSVLAGEPWSDHPRCTHPLLAHLARMVNDVVADPARQRLVPLLPEVIGLTGPGERWDLELAHLAVVRAVAVADADQAGPLMAGLLTTDRALARVDGRTPGQRRPSTRRLTAAMPEVTAWAEDFTAGLGLPRSGTADLARAVLDRSVAALARAEGDRDGRLVGLLEDAVETCRTLAGAPSGFAAAWARPAVAV